MRLGEVQASELLLQSRLNDFDAIDLFFEQAFSTFSTKVERNGRSRAPGLPQWFRWSVPIMQLHTRDQYEKVEDS